MISNCSPTESRLPNAIIYKPGFQTSILTALQTLVWGFQLSHYNTALSTVTNLAPGTVM